MAKKLSLQERTKGQKRVAAPVARPSLVADHPELFAKVATKPKSFTAMVRRNGNWVVDIGIPGVEIGSDTNDRAEVQALVDEINAHAEAWFAERAHWLLGQLTHAARKRKVAP